MEAGKVADDGEVAVELRVTGVEVLGALICKGKW